MLQVGLNNFRGFSWLVPNRALFHDILTENLLTGFNIYTHDNNFIPDTII
jgi:hypothetical protein